MHRADNLTTFMCPLSWNLGALTSWDSQSLSRSVQGLNKEISRRVRKIARSDCLYVRTERFGCHWTEFHELWWLGIFGVSVEEIQDSLKCDQNNGYSAWRPIHIIDHISLNYCALVRNQPNTSLRPTLPIRTRSHGRLHPQTSNGTGIPSQPPRRTPNPHNTHQETEKTLDIRWDKMRWAHWTDTWINDTTNTTSAYRELVQCFMIANKVL